jgi:hypothetical protein
MKKLIVAVQKNFGTRLKRVANKVIGIEQCGSNWVPQTGVLGSERRKSVMAEEFYWLS